MSSTWTWKAKFQFRILGLPGTSGPAPSPGLPPLPPLVAPLPIPCVGTAQPAASPSAVPPTHPPQELPWPPRSCSDTPEHGEEPVQSLKVGSRPCGWGIPGPEYPEHGLQEGGGVSIWPLGVLTPWETQSNRRAWAETPEPRAEASLAHTGD